MVRIRALLAKPWIWSFVGAFLVWIAAVAFTRGHGGGGMIIAALSLAVFMVIVGIGQMFVITLGPGNVDLSLPANIGLASAVAMKVMDGNDGMVAIGLLAALACGFAIGAANYLLIWALRIPPIIATLSAAFIIQSIDISYGRGLQIKPPPGFAEFANLRYFGIPVLAILARLRAIAAGLNGHKVTLVPASVTGRVPVLEIAVPDALALSARLQRGDPPVHLSERHTARGVLTLDPQVLLPEHDALLTEALRLALSWPGNTSDPRSSTSS